MSMGPIKTKTLQIRLRSKEREILDQVRLRDLEAGAPHAKTLSAWIRHAILPFLESDCSTHPCQISNDLHQKVEELARLLNKTPETTIAECVIGIENLIFHTNAQRPLIVAEWRLRQQYGQCRRRSL